MCTVACLVVRSSKTGLSIHLAAEAIQKAIELARKSEALTSDLLTLVRNCCCFALVLSLHVLGGGF